MSDIHHPEPTEVSSDLSQYLSLVLNSAFEELRDEKFRNKDGVAPGFSETMMGVLSNIGKDGLDTFKLVKSELTPNGNEFILEKTLGDGTQVQVTYNGPEISLFESSTMVVRNVAIRFQKADQSTGSTVELHNLETADAKKRINSTLIIDNGINPEKYNNPEDVTFGEIGKENSEVIHGFRYWLVKGASLVDSAGDPVLDIHQLFEESGGAGTIVIGLPNIEEKTLGPLVTAIQDYSAENYIPIYGRVYSSIGPGYSPVGERVFYAGGVAESGGKKLDIRIYPKEFFKSSPASLQVFRQKVSELNIGR